MNETVAWSRLTPEVRAAFLDRVKRLEQKGVRTTSATFYYVRHQDDLQPTLRVAVHVVGEVYMRRWYWHSEKRLWRNS